MWLEGRTDAAFLPHLVARELSISLDCVKVLVRRGGCIVGLGHRLHAPLKEFLYDRCSHILVCADNHHVASALRAQRIEQVHRIVCPHPCVVCVAVEELEAWFLADYVTLSNVVGAPPLPKPPRVEGITAPKDYLERTLGRALSDGEMMRLANEMDLDRARAEAPSLDRFLKDLAAWK
jgi:hypothetical protein